MSRCGTAEDHCCYFRGEVCQYVEPAPASSPFKWRCRLRAERDNWEAVHASPEYVANVKPLLTAVGYPDTDCGDWPPPGVPCKTCGEGVAGG